MKHICRVVVGLLVAWVPALSYSQEGFVEAEVPDVRVEETGWRLDIGLVGAQAFMLQADSEGGSGVGWLVRGLYRSTSYGISRQYPTGSIGFEYGQDRHTFSIDNDGARVHGDYDADPQTFAFIYAMNFGDPGTQSDVYFLLGFGLYPGFVIPARTSSETRLIADDGWGAVTGIGVNYHLVQHVKLNAEMRFSNVTYDAEVVAPPGTIVVPTSDWLPADQLNGAYIEFRAGLILSF